MDRRPRAPRRGRVFSEQISTRTKLRPELEAALALVTEIKTAAPAQPVVLCVHEMKRLARNAAELIALSATLQTRDVALELLTGPTPGIYDPHGMGSMLFAVLAVAAQLDRDCIREDPRRPSRPPTSTPTCSSSPAHSAPGALRCPSRHRETADGAGRLRPAARGRACAS